MKFDLAINLERADNSLSMKDVKNHTLEMVQMADQSGFNIVWAAEHHALETVSYTHLTLPTKRSV